MQTAERCTRQKRHIFRGSGRAEVTQDNIRGNVAVITLEEVGSMVPPEAS